MLPALENLIRFSFHLIQENIRHCSIGQKSGRENKTTILRYTVTRNTHFKICILKHTTLSGGHTNLEGNDNRNRKVSAIELHVTCSNECLPWCKITIQFQIPSSPINLESRRQNKKHPFSHIQLHERHIFKICIL